MNRPKVCPLSGCNRVYCISYKQRYVTTGELNRHMKIHNLNLLEK